MAIAIVLILLTVGSVLFHFWSPWWFTPLASDWGEMDDTLIITFVITGIVFVAINLFIAYCVFRFRYKKERKALYEPENKQLEWWLTIVTSIGIVIMLAPGLFVYAKFVDIPKHAFVFEAVGHQWQWTFRFPGKDGVLGTVDPKMIGFKNTFGMNPEDPNGQDDVLIKGSEVHIPLGKPTQIFLRSKDVLHDFYVPHFRVKMDLVPGLVSSLWLTPTRTGRFEVACAEYCGIGHHTMRGLVVVDEEEDFNAWLAAQPTYADTLRKAARPSAGLVERGQEIAEDQGCIGCHSLDGSPSVGPTWKGLFGKTEKLDDGSTVVVDEDYLKESIVDPNARIVQGYQGIMPPYELTDEELKALIAFTVAQSNGHSSSAETDDLVSQGRELAEDNGCLGCHSLDGSASVGPTWLKMFGKTEKLADGNTVVVDEDYLRESVVDPNISIVDGYSGIMPPYELSKQELDALVAYMKSGDYSAATDADE